jgi:restriction system protein
MEHLAAALLRAIGYRTEVTLPGPDRGKDVIASRDGFGFERPRIVVEVKHRPTTRIDAPLVRAFAGGLHDEDRGLYISTGGFTREAQYEADRARVPIKLLGLEAFAKSIVEHYAAFDDEGRRILPLTKLYWPVQ